MLNNIKNFLTANKTYLSLGSILLGIVVDSIWISRPDTFYVNAVLLGHFVLTAICILLLNAKNKVLTLFFIPTKYILQFSFGALAGSLLVLYGQSGTVASSFVFFIIFIAFLVGNEFLHHQYEKIYIHLTVWYFLLITYCNIIVPIIFKKFGNGTFVISMLLSLFIAFLFLRILYRISNREIKNIFASASVGIFAIFVVYSSLYIAKIIPPVPLSAKSIGVYHYIEKEPDGDYYATYEPKRFWQFWRKTSAVYSWNGTDPVYCFSSTFAPTHLNIQIAHRWEYRKDSDSEWQTSSYIKFPISGGRDGGYRAYTKKNNLEEGEYRCNIETSDGVLIGRTDFEVVKQQANNVRETSL